MKYVEDAEDPTNKRVGFIKRHWRWFAVVGAVGGVVLMATWSPPQPTLASYQLAAERGEAWAQYWLGYLYDHGERVPEDEVDTSTTAPADVSPMATGVSA